MKVSRSTLILVIIGLLMMAFPAKCQKWYKLSTASTALSMAAGYSQGWRDEVQYHPNQLFNQFPNLNRNVWDIRVQNKPGFLNTEWDADHVLRATTTALHVAAFAVKVGDYRKLHKKHRWKKLLFDAGTQYLAYKAGHFLAWNITHKNKL